jgi:hypothetical protein
VARFVLIGSLPGSSPDSLSFRLAFFSAISIIFPGFVGLFPSHLPISWKLPSPLIQLLCRLPSLSHPTV